MKNVGVTLMDLFKVIVDIDKLHPNFRNLLKEKYAQTVLNEWSLGFVDRDNKFVKEFQTTFNSSFWELYLHAIFTYLRFKINYSYKAPDFNISKNNLTINVEAVTTNHPKDGTPEYDRIEALEKLYSSNRTEAGREEILEEIVSLSTERIMQSIIQKSKKYIENYGKLNHVKGTPFVLAIGSYEQPLFYYQGTGAIERVLYGLKEAKYIEGKPFFDFTDNVLKRSNNALIPIGVFNDNKYGHISAVIFNPVASFGKVRALQLKKSSRIFFETYRYNDYGQKGLKPLLAQWSYILYNRNILLLRRIITWLVKVMVNHDVKHHGMEKRS